MPWSTRVQPAASPCERGRCRRYPCWPPGLGFAYGDGDASFKLIPVNTEDDVLHVRFGIAAFRAGPVSREVPPPTTAPPT
jgi:hypothetical protein